jgi:hypothetical protein
MAAAGAAAAAPPVYTAHFAAGNNPTAWFGLPATSPLALAIGDVLVARGTNFYQRRVPYAFMEALVLAVAVRDDSETLGTLAQRMKKTCITRVINYLFGAWNPPLGTTYVTTLVAAQRAARPLLPRAPPPGPDPLALRASDFEALSAAGRFEPCPGYPTAPPRLPEAPNGRLGLGVVRRQAWRASAAQRRFACRHLGPLGGISIFRAPGCVSSPLPPHFSVR